MSAVPKDAVDEFSGDDLTKEHVEQRMRDWLKRVNDLFGNVRKWVGPAIDVRVVGQKSVQGELMKRHGIAAYDIDIAAGVQEGRTVFTLEPRGLWIIGANGRVDLTTPSGDRFIIVDVAKNFEAPSWSIVDPKDRRHITPLDREALLSAMGTMREEFAPSAHTLQ